MGRGNSFGACASLGVGKTPLLSAKVTGVAMLEMLLVLSLLAIGLVAMLKLYTQNEVLWQRLTRTYCTYLIDSENEAINRLKEGGLEMNWNTDWLQQCDSRHR